MPHLLIFGPGYTASRIAAKLGSEWLVTQVRRTGDADSVAFGAEAAVRAALATATHILSSVPPDGDVDPVLARYGEALAAAPARWIGYLSSTGVYGDTDGAWVDESASVGTGRRTARARADLAWQALRDDVRVFRLPGIYGPGRSAFERIAEGKARRIDLPGKVFSRVHVDDIASGVIAGFEGPPGVYNLADDRPSGQNEVIEYACALLGREPPPLLSLEDAQLSPTARAYYDENRRVANGKAKRLLGWAPLYPDYRAGLRALRATMSPASASKPPSAASQVQT